MKPIKFGSFVLGLVGAFNQCVWAADYSFTSIAVPGASATYPAAINKSGTVVGYWLDSKNISHGYIYFSGILLTLDYPGAKSTSLAAINTQNDIVGTYYDSAKHAHGFFFSQGVFSSVDAGPGQDLSLTALNNRGTAAGVLKGKGLQYAFTYTGGVFNYFAETEKPVPTVINDAGMVTGLYETEYPKYSEYGWSFLYSHAHVRRLPFQERPPYGYPPGGLFATGMNASGTVVGDYVGSPGGPNPYIFKAGGNPSFDMSCVISPNGPPAVYFAAINDADTVVGNNQMGSDFNVVVATATTCQILTFPGSISTTATAINNAGKILGQYTKASGVIETYIATPAP